MLWARSHKANSGRSRKIATTTSGHLAAAAISRNIGASAGAPHKRVSASGMRARTLSSSWTQFPTGQALSSALRRRQRLRPELMLR